MCRGLAGPIGRAPCRSCMRGWVRRFETSCLSYKVSISQLLTRCARRSGQANARLRRRSGSEHPERLTSGVVKWCLGSWLYTLFSFKIAQIFFRSFVIHASQKFCSKFRFVRLTETVIGGGHSHLRNQQTHHVWRGIRQSHVHNNTPGNVPTSPTISNPGKILHRVDVPSPLRGER